MLIAGLIHVGIGISQGRELFSTLNILPLRRTYLTKLQQEVVLGAVISVADMSCKDTLTKEKEMSNTG